MRILKGLILLILFISPPAKAVDIFSWMLSSFGGLKSLLGCLEVPEFTSFHEGNTALDMTNSNEWVSTGSSVEEKKLLKINWSTKGVTPKPKKYLVLYRIDPRFITPQIYIKTYNYGKKKYEVLGFPGFSTANDGVIPPDKDLAALSFPKMRDYVSYFTNSTSTIPVSAGDIINISLIGKDHFFNTTTENNILTREVDTNILAAPALYTESNLGNLDNRIIYASSEQICDLIDQSRSGVCKGTGANTKYKNIDNMILVGKPMSIGSVQNLMGLLDPCPANSSLNTRPACYYNHGRGMEIKIGGQVVKSRDTNFVNNSNTLNGFIYHQAASGGNLTFGSNWSTNGMFTPSASMSNWVSRFSNNFSDFSSYINNTDWSANFLYFGRYTMTVEIGNGNSTISDNDLRNIKVEYVIMPGGQMPNDATSGFEVDQHFAGDAYQSGYLWLRVKNPNSAASGVLNVNYTNYTGTTWFSNIVYNGAIKPITDQFQGFTEAFFVKLVKHAALQYIAKTAMTLYVIIFVLMFIMGAVKLTAQEVVIRVAKIAIVAFLIRPESWEFFNQYVFSAFLQGIDYFITNIVGATSSRSNIFGFIDPIFDKLTNGRIWGLLFIQLLQIHNGLAFVAIVVIYSLITYFRAVLEVIIGYIVAFIGMTVMISLAPFFIILMLFEKTKSLFDNWTSILLSNLVQPTILLVFFLLIDQIISEQLVKVIVRACWDTLIPIKIGLDLNHLGISLDFSFTLPFLPGIPFFVPNVPEITAANLLTNDTNTFLVLFTTALLFYAYCLMAYGLVNYVTVVVGQLTNVTPARIEGVYQSPTNPTASIIGDIKSVTNPIVNIGLSPIKTFKDKVIDQNYRARAPRGDGKNTPEYTNKLFASRNDEQDE